MDEKILLSCKPVEIAEVDSDYKHATFIISVLGEYDMNGRMIPKETAESEGSSLIGSPILAKLVYDPQTGKPCDFADHACYISTDENGNQSVRFGTTGIGSVIEQWIEKRKVDGFDEEKDCLLIKAKLWNSRYPEYMSVLDKLWKEKKVCSSWELTAHEKTKTVQGNILKAITFLGNCIIGTKPAVPQAGIVEYASLQENVDELNLAVALSKDIAAFDINQNQEDKTKVAKKTDDKTIENEFDFASLTDRDIRYKIAGIISAKSKKYYYVEYFFPNDKKVWAKSSDSETDLDYIEFTYQIAEDDTITVSEGVAVKLTVSVAEINQTLADKERELSEAITAKNAEIAQRDEAITTANETINTLNKTIADLTPFKEEHERLEAARIEAETAQKREEIKATFIASKLFSEAEIEAEEIQKIITEADMVVAKALIADKFIANMKQGKHEIASKKTDTPRVDIEDEKVNLKDFINSYRRDN